MMKIDDKTKIFICHEYKLLQISSFVQAYRNTHRDQMLKLKPQSQVSGIKPQTIHLFLHWLYSNQFTEPGEESCGFSELLELYCFGQVYGITVLKNTVIDRLIEKCSVFCIPARCTRRIYKYTEPGDQLRKLWVDIYVWEVTEERFKDELRSGKLDPTFLRDLALAQMYKIRSIQKQSGGPGGFSPPYEKSKEAYHKPDAKTGVCCSRRQYEGEECHHDRGFHEQEAAKLRTMLEKVRVKLDSLKRKESQNSSLRRNLHKMQLKLSKAEMMVKTHVSIDHSKLLKVGAWDNPEVNHPEVMRRQKVVTRLQH